MRKLRIIFMGTPDFSVPALETLLAGEHEVIGVFSQPDRPKGRGKQLQPTPVKEVALRANIPVYQPVSINTDECQSLLKSLAPDVIIVIAYGKILPPWLLALPTYGCINIHASILPDYRGAAPIHWAILNGDKETGVTFMQMNEGMDTGDILHIEKIDIKPKETTGELFDRLSLLGATTLPDVLSRLLEGRLIPQKQEEEKATYAGKIEKSLGYIHWQESAEKIERYIYGLAPSPGCVTLFEGKRFKIWEADAEEGHSPATPGTIIEVGSDYFNVATGSGILQVTEIQPENKKRMSVADFLSGHMLTVGQKFDELN